MRYGRLTLLEEEGNTQDKHKCKCDCGEVTSVLLYSLRSGNTKSCGCIQKEMMSNTFTTHGKTRSTEYTSWQLMKDRCYNKNNKTFSYYGGKGITVCDRWINSFENFIDDMGEKPTPTHSIDRIDNAEGYSPENCKWSSKKEQVRNRRNTKLIVYKNQEKPLAEWCEILDLDYPKINKRLWRGWPVEKSFKEK